MKKKVLVIDTIMDEWAQKLFAKLLNESGYIEASFANSNEEITSFLLENVPDSIILEPVSTIELKKELDYAGCISFDKIVEDIKKLNLTKDPRWIFLSDVSFERLIGIDSFDSMEYILLVKPVPTSVIIEAILN